MALSDAEIDNALGSLRDWRRAGNAIEREYRFGSFREAISFVVRLAFEAEQRDHHPELTSVYNRVTIRLTTHDEGGVTGKDLALAQAIDGVSWV